MPPSRCCSSVNPTLKSKLKSLPNEDAQGNVDPVRDRRAGRTPCRVVRPEHEVVDEELRAPSEEVCQRGAALVGLESILLVDPNPRQLLPPLRQLVAAPGELLLRPEQLEPRGEPLFT